MYPSTGPAITLVLTGHLSGHLVPPLGPLHDWCTSSPAIFSRLHFRSRRHRRLERSFGPNVPDECEVLDGTHLGSGPLPKQHLHTRIRYSQRADKHTPGARRIILQPDVIHHHHVRHHRLEHSRSKEPSRTNTSVNRVHICAIRKTQHGPCMSTVPKGQVVRPRRYKLMLPALPVPLRLAHPREPKRLELARMIIYLIVMVPPEQRHPPSCPWVQPSRPTTARPAWPCAPGPLIHQASSIVEQPGMPS